MSINYSSLGLVYLLAIMSPGPSIAVILKNSLSYSYRHGIFTAFGTVAGISLQCSVMLMSFKLLTESQYLYSILGIFLSFYLFFIGIRYLLDSFNYQFNGMVSTSQSNIFRKRDALKEGFFVDAFNPLALSFFLAIFSTYINLNHDYWISFLCWIEIILLGAFWYIGFSLLISIDLFQKIIFVKLGKKLNFLTSFIIIFLSIKIFVENVGRFLSS